MRRWMHTCYTLVTREDSQTLICKSLSSLGHLHSFALQRCFSAEQMSKRPLKEVVGMYLYTPQSKRTVTCQLSKTRGDRTRQSLVTVEILKFRLSHRTRWSLITVEILKFRLSDRTRRSEVIGRVRSCRELTVTRPDARPCPIGDDRTRPVVTGPY
jgi:hypothetical protein